MARNHPPKSTDSKSGKLYKNHKKFLTGCRETGVPVFGRVGLSPDPETLLQVSGSRLGSVRLQLQPGVSPINLDLFVTHEKAIAVVTSTPFKADATTFYGNQPNDNQHNDTKHNKNETQHSE
jgi:hypothetical protein